MNWLTTNARIPPTNAKPLSKISATAPPRGAPRRSRKSTAGNSSAVSIVASAIGTTITSSRLITQSNATTAARITNSRHDHAAALRTSGVTAWSSSVRAGWHPDSVTACHAFSADLGNRRPHALPCRSCPTTRRRATPAAERAGPARGKYWWLRWAIIGIAVVVLAVELVLVWDQLAKAWKSLLLGQLVVGAGGGRGGDGIDARLRRDPAQAAALGGGRACTSGGPRRRSTPVTR